MNGPEHYREAERLLETAALDFDSQKRWVRRAAAHALAASQVHATLALVAATVDQTAARGPGDFSEEWSGVVWS